ncbi:hypothetical protein BC835DRAFT_1312656 [Cytidiella melzeri]|nr:hypothetical protein BC835DRAFT_1312656 [Cytidiella melzeri]
MSWVTQLCLLCLCSRRAADTLVFLQAGYIHRLYIITRTTTAKSSVDNTQASTGNEQRRPRALRQRQAYRPT